MTKQIEAVAGSILFALILIVGINLGGDAINHVVTPPKPDIASEIAEAPPEGETPATDTAAAPEAAQGEAAQGEAAQGDGTEAGEGIEAVAPEPIVPLLAAASPEAGQAVAKKCAACHTFDEGGANRVGPNLHGIVGRDIATVEGFSYSQILGTLPGEWSYEKLDAFLLNPKAVAPGTKMAFAGIKSQDDRAALIAYLRSLSPNAPPLE